MTKTKNGIKDLNMNNNNYTKNFKVWSNYCDSVNRMSPYTMQFLFEELADANAKNGEAGKEQRIVACTMCGRILYRC